MNLFKKRKFYFCHIRKTGGSTLNYSLLAGLGNPEKLYKELSQNLKITSAGKTVVGWNVAKLNSESYFYGFSHHPYELIKPFKSTYTITIFRDPLDRVVSHYKMLKMFELNNTKHPVMESEGKWIVNGALSFVEKIPNEHLLRQLVMYSSKFSVKEAFQKINSLSKIININDINSFICNEFSALTQLNLKPIYRNESKYSLSDEETEILLSLKPRLEPEYELFDKLNLHFK